MMPQMKSRYRFHFLLPLSFTSGKFEVELKERQPSWIGIQNGRGMDISKQRQAESIFVLIALDGPSVSQWLTQLETREISFRQTAKPVIKLSTGFVEIYINYLQASEWSFHPFSINLLLKFISIIIKKSMSIYRKLLKYASVAIIITNLNSA